MSIQGFVTVQLLLSSEWIKQRHFASFFFSFFLFFFGIKIRKIRKKKKKKEKKRKKDNIKGNDVVVPLPLRSKEKNQIPKSLKPVKLWERERGSQFERERERERLSSPPPPHHKIRRVKHHHPRCFALTESVMEFWISALPLPYRSSSL